MRAEHAAASDQAFILDDAQRFEPTAAASGLPPKVEPCEPGVNTSITSRVPRKAETGSTPPPSALPTTSPSGRTPSCSLANQAPVRPSPDWTSSRMSST